MIKIVNFFREIVIAFGLSCLYWVVFFLFLSGDSAFKAFRYMGF